MSDGSQMEEVNGAVGLGLFAGDVVLALGRAIEAGNVVKEDRPILKRAGQLLSGLQSEPDTAQTSSGGTRYLARGDSALDVLTAVESEAADTDLDAFLTPLITALAASLKGDIPQQTDSLRVLRRVFAAIGDAEVARVSYLSRPRSPNLPLWQTSAATSRS